MDENGDVTLETIEKNITDKTKIIAITHFQT